MGTYPQRQGNQSLDPDRASLQEAILAVIEADTWTASERVVVAHPELLDDEADRLLLKLAEIQHDDAARLWVEKHRAVLQRCQEVGIGPAFAEFRHEVPPALREAFGEALAADARGVVDDMVAGWGSLTRAEAFATAPPGFRAHVFDASG